MTEMRHKSISHRIRAWLLPTSLLRVRRLGRRAILVFGSYAALLLAVFIAGFIGQAVGIWASILWGAVVIAGLVLYGRRRLRQPRVDST